MNGATSQTVEESLSQRALKTLFREGVTEFFAKSVDFVWTQLIRAAFSVDNSGIKKLAVEQTETEPAESITITYDGRSKSTIPASIRRMEKEVTMPPRYVLGFKNAKIIDEDALVNVGRKFFRPTSVGNSRPNLHVSKRSLRTVVLPTPSPDRHLESGFIIGAERDGFAHWFYEQLPKLRWYEAYCARTGSNPDLIVSGDLTDWQARSLELIGYPPGSYIRRRDSEVVEFNKLLIPPHPRRTRGNEFQVCPSAIHWVRNRILSNVPPVSREFPDRVYVSRGETDRRQVVNEEQVVSLLGEHGFESFEPGRLSFVDQVHLFANVEVMVGPHGGGLTNMLYADGAQILELQNEEASEHFFVLANECGHSYELIQCNTIDDEETKPRHGDMKVDLKKLEQTINSFVENIEQPSP